MALGLVMSLACLSRPASARCVLPPAQRARTVVPSSAEADVPISVHPRVVYEVGAAAFGMCGGDPPAPSIRVASVQGDGSAQAVDGGASVAGSWVRGTDEDPRTSVIWIFRPQGTLRPSTTYELVDGYPTSCGCDTMQCLAGPLAVFARFTTSTTADTIPPSYTGLDHAFCLIDQCTAGDETCCGPYSHLSYHFVPFPDAFDVNLVGLHLYARKDGESYDFSHPLGPIFSDPVDSPYAPKWDLTLTPGTWHVLSRAFDSSENEDGNMNEVSFTFPLASDRLCRKVIQDGGSPPDLQFVYPPDFPPATDDAASVDAYDSYLAGGGCDCDVGHHGGARGPSLLDALVAMALLATIARRRRKGSHEAGRPTTDANG